MTDAAPKAGDPWISSEYEVLRRRYPLDGAKGVREELKHRSEASIKVIAHREGIRGRPRKTAVRVADERILAAIEEAQRRIEDGGYTSGRPPIRSIAAEIAGCCRSTINVRLRAMQEREFLARKAALIAELATLEMPA